MIMVMSSMTSMMIVVCATAPLMPELEGLLLDSGLILMVVPWV